jgi:hypothetical protein
MVSNPPGLAVTPAPASHDHRTRTRQHCEPVSDFIALPALPRPKVARHRAASRPCAGRRTSHRRGAARSGLRHGDPRNEPGARVASPTIPCRQKARGTNGVAGENDDLGRRAVGPALSLRFGVPNRRADAPPIGELLGPGSVREALWAGMAHREYPGLTGCNPR